jgi:hypothetical protein
MAACLFLPPMRNGPIPITFALAALLAAGACGAASDKEIQEARNSGYKGDFAVIYSETLVAVRELYPEVTEDARTGVIRTAWHPVHVQQSADDDSSGQGQVNPRNSRTGFQSTAVLREQFFVRFDIRVVGGRPWRVRVDGQASSWKAGEQPQPMRGSEIPQWLDGRVSALEVAIHDRLKEHTTAVKYAPPKPAVKRSAPVDMAKFGQVPPAAAKIIASVEQAATTRDVDKLRSFMIDDFTYSTGDEPSADTAIIVWRADPSILGELAKAVGAGCAHDQARREVVCPGAYLQDAAQAGYRAGFREANGAWRLAYFTHGE